MKTLTARQNKKNYMKINSVLPFSVVKGKPVVFFVNHMESDWTSHRTSSLHVFFLKTGLVTNVPRHFMLIKPRFFFVFSVITI